MPSPSTPQPDQQPTLTDGDLVLRPWADADSEAARRQHDDLITRWSGPCATPTAEQHLAWIGTTHDEWADDRSKVTFVVEAGGEPVGSVDVRRGEPGVGALSWVTFAPHRGRGIASRAVRLLIEWAFSEAGLGLRRVEAAVDSNNTSSVRTALRSGLRREGLLRGNAVLGGAVRDTVVLGRLSGDPAPGTRDGFTAMLNSELPTKRVIAQGLVRNSAGAILLCELAYKREWDLPGGIVDPGESPAACLVREIREELDVEVELTRLIAVNWLKPWLGWADAVLLVFEVSPVGDDLLDRVHLLERELRGAHWVQVADAAQHVAPYNARMLGSLAAAPRAPSCCSRTGCRSLVGDEPLVELSRPHGRVFDQPGLGGTVQPSGTPVPTSANTTPSTRRRALWASTAQPRRRTTRGPASATSRRVAQRPTT